MMEKNITKVLYFLLLWVLVPVVASIAFTMFISFLGWKGLVVAFWIGTGAHKLKSNGTVKEIIALIASKVKHKAE